MKLKTIIIFFCMVFSSHILGDPDQKTFLVFGGRTGWIGQQIVECIQKEGHIAIPAIARLEDRRSIEEQILRVKPDFIINAAGITGTPNIDWCEDHKQETIRCNVIGTLNVADMAYLHNIHCTNIATGCIYEYDSLHPIYSGKGFKEEEEPNFVGSFYSETKIAVEKLLINYPNILQLRIRMPISGSFHPRNLIVKLTRYKKVLVNMPNSITVLDDLLPLIPQMALKKITGIYNFVNPGAISHNEILDLYKQYVDSNFTYNTCTEEEQNNFLKAKRSTTELDTSKLLALFSNIPEIRVSLINLLKKMKK